MALSLNVWARNAPRRAIQKHATLTSRNRISGACIFCCGCRYGRVFITGAWLSNAGYLLASFVLVRSNQRWFDPPIMSKSTTRPKCLRAPMSAAPVHTGRDSRAGSRTLSTNLVPPSDDVWGPKLGAALLLVLPGPLSGLDQLRTFQHDKENSEDQGKHCWHKWALFGAQWFTRVLGVSRQLREVQ